MQDRLGDEYPAFLAALERAPVTSIHLNPLKPWNPPADSRSVPWYQRGYYLCERPVFTLDPAFHAGAYYVQEAGSMFLAAAVRQVVDLSRPLKVLDLCAAPGGKSTLLASLISSESFLLANEVIRARYQILRYNLAKWGHDNTFISNHDSSDFAPLAGYFDLVLVDAPCSGEGLFRKDPEAVAEWSPAHVQHCAARQRRILTDAAALVRPGGALIYSTCTYNAHENDENARRLAEETDLEYRKLDIPADWGIEERRHGYQLYPHRVEGEGLFLAAFLRPAGPEARFRLPVVFRRLRPITKAEVDIAARWLAPEQDPAYYTEPAGQWRAVPSRLNGAAMLLADVLPRIEVGWPLGTLKGKEMVPAAELALHGSLNPALISFALDETQALNVLRKDGQDLPGLPKGWVLATYQGLGLAWLKGLGHRYNNYYPTEWRIRMAV